MLVEGRNLWVKECSKTVFLFAHLGCLDAVQCPAMTLNILPVVILNVFVLCVLSVDFEGRLVR